VNLFYLFRQSPSKEVIILFWNGMALLSDSERVKLEANTLGTRCVNIQKEPDSGKFFNILPWFSRNIRLV
jgi:UDP-N-acetylglucosamine 2-epimerase